MSFEKNQPNSEHCDASMLIPHFSRLRAIRAYYRELEAAKYPRSWEALELLDGAKGDVGDLSKLETGRRGLRDGYSPDKLAHEVVDCAWSLVVSADSNLIDPEFACEEADRRGALTGTPRQFINRLNLTFGMIDEVVDPSEEPLFVHDLADRDALLTGYYAEGFRATCGLAHEYDFDLAQAINHNMDTLEQRIKAEIENS